MASIKIKASFTGVPVSPLVNIEDEGVLIVSTQDLNFVGAGVTVTENPLGTAEIDIPGTTIDIEDEGVAIITNPGAINFIGAGVTVTENPLGTAEIDIPGNPLTVKDDGASIIANPANMNFIGAGVTVTEDPAGTAKVNIPGTAPSGVSGAIQFSNGSAFASDANNFFWDDTNNRLGVGTNAPAYPLQVSKTGLGHISFIGSLFSGIRYDGIEIGSTTGGVGFLQSVSGTAQPNPNTYEMYIQPRGGNVGIGISVAPTAKLQIKGSGATNATNSLLITNSSNNENYKLNDAGEHYFSVNGNGRLQIFNSHSNFGAQVIFQDPIELNAFNRCQISYDATNNIGQIKVNDNTSMVNIMSFSSLSTAPRVGIGKNIVNANITSVLELQSTTQGFLPPRMTTVQKNAIVAPAAGLMVYDTTLNKLCVFTTAWETITSV